MGGTLTCDVCRPQLGHGEDDGRRGGLPGRDALFPGQVMLSGMADELDAFRDGDFNVNLRGNRGGGDKGFRGDRGAVTSLLQESPSLVSRALLGTLKAIFLFLFFF